MGMGGAIPRMIHRHGVGSYSWRSRCDHLRVACDDERVHDTEAQKLLGDARERHWLQRGLGIVVKPKCGRGKVIGELASLADRAGNLQGALDETKPLHRSGAEIRKLVF